MQKLRKNVYNNVRFLNKKLDSFRALLLKANTCFLQTKFFVVTCRNISNPHQSQPRQNSLKALEALLFICTMDYYLIEIFY